MTIDIQYVQMQTSESMSDITIKKLEKLHTKYDWIIRAEVFFKLENDHRGKGKICEIQLSLPGPRIFAKSNEGSFEKAVQTTVHELDKQLNKRKEIFHQH